MNLLAGAVDRYYEETLSLNDAVLAAALESSAAAGLPAIQISACQGKLLQLLAKTVGARRILEIGTLGGYSTIWLARSLPPDGELITLELNPKHAEVAEANLRRAGLAPRVSIRLGPALATLEALVAERAGPFDFVFIDADKVGTADYFARALELTRSAGLIVVDNVAREGAVADERSTDPNVQGIRRFLAAVAREPRVEATAIQTIGAKSHDGFALLRVR